MKNFKINKEDILYCMKVLSIGGAISFALVGSFSGGYYYRKAQEEYLESQKLSYGKSNHDDISLPTYFYEEHNYSNGEWINPETTKEYNEIPKNTDNKYYVYKDTNYR